MYLVRPINFGLLIFCPIAKGCPLVLGSRTGPTDKTCSSCPNAPLFLAFTETTVVSLIGTLELC